VKQKNLKKNTHTHTHIIDSTIMWQEYYQ
jgi:hypothetical protein